METTKRLVCYPYEFGCMLTEADTFVLTQHCSDYPPPPLIRPIFDWSEVGEIFPPASSRVDYSLLYQVYEQSVLVGKFVTVVLIFIKLLSKKMQEVTPSAEEQSLVQGLCTKVSTVMENMIVTGEGEELVNYLSM